MLVFSDDTIFSEVTHDLAVDMFKKLATIASQGYRSIFCWVCSATLLGDGGDVGSPPIQWEVTSVMRLFEDKFEDRSNFMGSYL